MKKFVLILTMGLAVCALTGFVGCSDDDETVLGPTAADSAKVEMIFGEFDDMGEVNGLMLNSTMHFIDSIMTAAGAGKTAAGVEIHVTLEWHAASEYWYCTAVDTSDSDGEVFNFVDSIQFLHGTTPVQFPVDSLLTEIRSDMRLTVVGEDIDTAFAWQNVVLTMENPESDTLIISGTGGLLAEVSEMEIEGTDTTVCDVYFNLGFVYTGLVFDLSSVGEGGELGCPLEGTLAATGSVDINCTGANEGSVSGAWAVTEVFDHGEVTITVQFGGFTFRSTETCD